MYHCLASPKGFLVDQTERLISDQSALWTDDAAQSVRFLGYEAAASRYRALHQAIPDLEIRLVSFAYASPGIWLAVDD